MTKWCVVTIVLGLAIYLALFWGFPIMHFGFTWEAVKVSLIAHGIIGGVAGIAVLFSYALTQCLEGRGKNV